MSRKRMTCGLLSRSSLLLASLLWISLLTLTACFFLLLPAYSSGKLSNHSLISLVCRASSSGPQTCESSLKLISSLALLPQSPAHLVSSAVALAHQGTQLSHAISQALLAAQSDEYPLDLASTARNCEYLLRRASSLLTRCRSLCEADVHANAAGFNRIKDIEAWVSAALTWENDCLSALGYVNGTHSGILGTHHRTVLQHLVPGLDRYVRSLSDDRVGTRTAYLLNQGEGQHSDNSPCPSTHTMNIQNGAAEQGLFVTDLINFLMQHLQTSITTTSNALGMLDAYDTYGENVSAWRPPSKKTLPGYQGFLQKRWHTDSIKSFVPTVTVSKDGHGTYPSIQEAVNNAPENLSERYVIYIQEGIYNESVRIPYTKPYLAFVGDGMGKTIITGNLNAQMPGVSTYDTATVGIDGDEFVAYNLTFENTADPALHQAVALRVSSDRSAFYHCAFLGHQDTLYAHSLRQIYQGCRIEGTIDFIFGNAASVFQDCEVLIRPGRTSSSVITAQGRTDPAQTTGFVFQNCIVNGTYEFMESFLVNPKTHKVYLGRPWKMFSRTIYKDSVIEKIIRPEGWRPWRGDFALKTLFYGEYNNTGIGANSTGRVTWAEQIPSSLAIMYTTSNFIQGHSWLSGTLA